ncbi:Mur ligase family protein [Priestia endophytica]|uniref:Mur ligase family protein n=1 Tax=Priestia endophytica TaxID=135735 RepID=UPI002E23B12B|nr:Mur ligase family protein [Priestia endophytica]MED4069818.1 Mur ligase family protein [Priestia endophytica]
MKMTFHNHKDCLPFQRLYGPLEGIVSSISYDSRNARKNTAFFCLRGTNCDGHLFIKEAIDNGASLIVGEDEAILRHFSYQYDHITFLSVEDLKNALSLFSSYFYHHADQALTTVGVTGTNGTAGIWDHEKELNFTNTTHTTPEAPNLHETFSHFVQKGLKAVSMEVTSIAIEQKRIEGILFDIAVHTNLTPDHLDFHNSFEEYKKAKLKLFTHTKKAVVNLDIEETL